MRWIDTNVFERGDEAVERALIHVSVLTVAGVQLQHVGVVGIGAGVFRRAAECLGSARRQPFDVVGSGAALKGVTHNGIRHAPLVPRTGQCAHRIRTNGVVQTHA